MQAFPGRGYYLEKANDWTAYYSAKIGVNGVETGMKLSEWLRTDVYKLLCLGRAGDLAVLMEELAPKFPEVCFVKSGETHLEIVAAGVDKATGLMELAGMLGVSPEEMIAFGDEANDLPMLKAVGTAYVMENAPEGVRREVRLVAPKNTQAGLAKIVNLYLNEGRMGRG